MEDVFVYTVSDGAHSDEASLTIAVTGVDTGNAADNHLLGTDGADQLVGKGGHDRLEGADGNDTLIGNNGRDTILGASGDDVLIGNRGRDVLHGGNDNDTLIGGSAKDFLWGGEGEDTFVFQRVGDSRAGGSTRDRIWDFERGEDVIDLSGIDAMTGGGGFNNTFQWIGESAFSGKKGELRYNDRGDKVLVQADRNGDGKADIEIQVDVGDLNSDDFIL